MAGVATPPRPTGMRAGIERYFEIALYLLLATGFVTLAGTGKLDPVSVFFISVVLIARGVLLARGKTVQIPEQWTNYITLVYVAFYLADFYLLSRSFVQATVHLVLFSMAVKVFSVHRERDNVYLAVLAFLMVLAAAVLTVDATFLFLFCLFLLLAVATFISLEMKRSAVQAKVIAGGTAGKWPRWLSGMAIGLVIGIAVAGLVFFYLLPRRTGGYLSSLAESNQFLTGFSDDVELGRIGQIQQSNAVVMHVQIAEGKPGNYSDMLWRGVALDQLDGRRWSRSPQRVPVPRAHDGSFYVAAIPLQSELNPAIQRTGLRPLFYRVLMQPVGTNVFFGAPFLVAVSGRYRTVWGDDSGSLYGQDSVGAYDAVSNIAYPTPEQLRASRGPYPFAVVDRDLNLPPMDERVSQLARSLTEKQSNEFDKAEAILQYLQTNYGYTLQLPSQVPADPIADFLFRRKRGHCEYFASAMALMLRTQGIPARVVNGFRGAEFNPVTGSYAVRASSAHSWVEVYFPGVGWASFDPTPGGSGGDGQSWSKLGMYMDALSEFWQEWVVNYDFGHQLTLQNRSLSRWQEQDFRVRRWMGRWYARLRHQTATSSFEPSRRRQTELALGVVLLVLALNARRIMRAVKLRRIASHPAQAPRAAATIWYERLTDLLARKGWRRRPSQTPAEFARSIPDERMRAPVERFTRHYEGARFGGSTHDAEKLPEEYEEITMLK